ncbi:nucleotide exchange factor GrpE [Oerskovia jenensis]|uniref:nucleotide exchange factor GrpE n=1 Tax=Oerskovia jenensis TaxID=162169 RepID=UPI0036D8342E
MTSDAQGPEELGSEDQPFHFTDKRKVTPEGQPKEAAPEGAGSGPGSAGNDAESDPLAGLDFEPTGEAGDDAALLAAQSEAAAHLDALQRERASFTNYRNRSLRDQEAARVKGVEDVLAALLPVLDDIDRARQHGELDGPFVAISDKLDASLAKFGIERYGVVGEEFDPTVHEALMHQVDPEATSATVNMVIEPGYRIGEKIVRAARVSVVGPE